MQFRELICGGFDDPPPSYPPEDPGPPPFDPGPPAPPPAPEPPAPPAGYGPQ
jgi:hypothetical protein